MNKPFYKSTGVMGSLAVIVSALVALAASLASLKGLEITPENQALIVSLVMTMCGGVVALIGRLKASDVAGAGVVLGEMASAVSLAVQPIRTFPAPPEDGACPKCGTKFGAHVLGCPDAGPRRVEADLAAGLERLEAPWSAPEQIARSSPVLSPPVDLHAVLVRLTDAVEALSVQSTSFVKDQAGCPSKDPAEPMAEGQLVGGNG